MPLARLRGVVEDKGSDWIIVGVGGIGIVASVPSTAADAVQPGDEAQLYTYLHVREDALTLYGFVTRDELRLFEQLIGVSGVGPKAALGLLSALDHARLASAIVSGDASQLRSVPGIGQKTAERIVLDLRDKVTPPEALPGEVVRTSGRGPDEQLVAALAGLGYTPAEAAAAADSLPPDGDLPLEERVRLALAFFSAPAR